MGSPVIGVDVTTDPRSVNGVFLRSQFAAGGADGGGFDPKPTGVTDGPAAGFRWNGNVVLCCPPDRVNVACPCDELVTWIGPTGTRSHLLGSTIDTPMLTLKSKFPFGSVKDRSRVVVPTASDPGGASIKR